MADTEHTWTLPGLTLRDLTVPVPLDRADPSRGSIEVFARVITAEGGADRPFLLYLQGGPGSEAPRPTGDPLGPAWVERALRDFQVVMLDQRGTGRSAPIGLDVPLEVDSVPAADGTGPARTLREADAAARAEHLACFRADAIVEDAEAVREALGVERWSVLGQSFGGFCTLRYLSEHPDSLTQVLFTGGLPAVGRAGDGSCVIDEVYALTWQRMIAASREHHRLFPDDAQRLRELSRRAAAGALLLPDGSRVSPERLRTLGHLLGASGGSERLHHLLDLPLDSPAFTYDLAAALPFGGRNPLYAVLHESCWADGGATGWAADRTMPTEVREDPTLLAGEHVHRSLFTQSPELAAWAETADLLAQRDWPALYDTAALAQTTVPGAAAVYHDDVYVPREFSLATAELLPGVRPWVTGEYAHNGLRAGGERVLDRLLDLAAGRALR